MLIEPSATALVRMPCGPWVHGNRAGESLDRRFGRCVGHRTAHRPLRLEGGDVDDRSGSAVGQVVVDRAVAARDGQREVAGDQVEDVARIRRVQPGVLEDGGVVHPPAKGTCRLFGRGRAGCDHRIAGVAADQLNPVVTPVQPVDHVEHDDRAVLGELFADGSADSRRASGDDVGQLRHFSSRRLLVCGIGQLRTVFWPAAICQFPRSPVSTYMCVCGVLPSRGRSAASR